MSLISIILATVVAVEHIYIFYLETVATTSQTTSRVFNMDIDELKRSSVTNLFKNQGVYNLVIALFLLYSLFVARNKDIAILMTLFVVIVAAYGSVTANKKIIVTQGGPAILALLSLLLF